MNFLASKLKGDLCSWIVYDPKVLLPGLGGWISLVEKIDTRPVSFNHGATSFHYEFIFDSTIFKFVHIKQSFPDKLWPFKY